MSETGFSRGIEKVIALAALDAHFHRRLMQDRQAAIESCDVELTDSERGILLEIPNLQLDRAINRVHVPTEARRQFLKGAVIAAVALVVGTCLLMPTAVSTGHRVSNTMLAESDCRQIILAQQVFRQDNGRYASSVEELVEAKVIEPLPSGNYPYRFEITESDADSFKLRAVPRQRGDALITADETGEIRVHRNGS